jgi:hypothetical protein
MVRSRYSGSFGEHMDSACHVHDPRYTFLPDHRVFIFVSQRIHVESPDVQDQSLKSYDYISSKQRSMTRTYLRKRSTGRGYRGVSRYGGSPTHDVYRHEDELHMGTSSPFGGGWLRYIFTRSDMFPHDWVDRTSIQ